MRVWPRIKYAFVALFTILFKGRLPVGVWPHLDPEDVPAEFAARVVPAAAPQPPPPAPSVADSAPAVQLLALLQRDGRLVDFLMEDLGSYSDAQIGAAVRDVHGGCRRVLDRYVTLEAILAGREREPVTVGQEFDPATVRLLGRVTGRPPFRGTLLHRGWRVSRVELPPPASGEGRSIVAPAEVEVA
jgi:hypothetical protein